MKRVESEAGSSPKRHTQVFQNGAVVPPARRTIYRQTPLKFDPPSYVWPGPQAALE